MSTECSTDSVAGSPGLGPSVPVHSLWNPWLRGPARPPLPEWSLGRLHALGHKVNVSMPTWFVCFFVLFFFLKNRNNYFKEKNKTFNRFHKRTCILPDSIFLKHTKKKKRKRRRRKKKTQDFDILSTDLPFPADNLSSSSSRFGAADPTQNLFPTR